MENKEKEREMVFREIEEKGIKVDLVEIQKKTLGEENKLLKKRVEQLSAELKKK
jgi:hypothetical protein